MILTLYILANTVQPALAAKCPAEVIGAYGESLPLKDRSGVVATLPTPKGRMLAHPLAVFDCTDRVLAVEYEGRQLLVDRNDALVSQGETAGDCRAPSNTTALRAGKENKPRYGGNLLRDPCKKVDK